MLFLLVTLAFFAAVRSVSAQVIVVEKPEFRALVPENAVVEKVMNDFQFVEGPAWDAAGGFLIFSDIPANKLYRYDPTTGGATVVRSLSHHANGNCYDASTHRLYTCEHETRALTVAPAGPKPNPSSKLVAAFEDKALNSPNDVVVKSDGSVWFTDPTYGLEKRSKEQATNNVYCYEEKKNDLRAVATDFLQPNGLCFSPDEKLLYVADSDKPRHIRVFDVTADNRLTNGRVFCAIDKGVPDGIRCDAAGNLWSSAGDGVQVFNPAGERLGRILVPETPANLCFGGVSGTKQHDLFITARTSLYRVKVTASPAETLGKQ